MSEFEDDFDDQLLALAGATERKERKRSKNKASRKRKNASDSEDERDVESEEASQSEDETNADPYPYEGQYIDEEDKERLLAMPEIKREEILAERIEEKQRLAEKQVLAQMVKQHQSGSGATSGMDEDSVARSAKRQHTARGATKEKTRKLDELKAKRKAKDESRKRAKLSPTQQRRSSSPQSDMELSEEEVGGQDTRNDQEEERERRLSGMDVKKPEAEDRSPATLQDFNECRVTRDVVAKWSMAPWFDTYAKGAWVRYLIGNGADGAAVYRMCEISEIAPELVKPYKVNDKVVNQAVILKHGKSLRQFNMDRISNSAIAENEYARWLQTCKDEGIKIPLRREVREKIAAMRKQESEPITDSVITAMLQRRKQIQSTKGASELTLEKSKLTQARSLALRRHDQKEAAELEEKIALIEAELNSLSSGASSSPRKAADDKDEVLRRVNERNRKANVEHVRRAELAESERRRKERELIAKAAASGDNAAAAAVVAKIDPSARLKTMPRLFNAATPSTRPGTPAVNSSNGTPVPSSAPPPPSNAAVRDISTANTTMAFEKKLLENIEIDLGDF